MKKLLTLALSSAILVSVVGCSSSKDDNKIVIGASSTPHAEILEVIKPQLEKEGYKLEIKVFDDYPLENTALEEGSIDANYFQHVPYLEETVASTGYKLTYTEKIHLEPMGLYSNSLKSINEIKDGATIAIPNDPTNGARALKLLANEGLIKVKEGELIGAKDITENPKNIKVKELAAEQLTSVLTEVDAAVINTNYALSANLNPTKDAIIIESKDSPYANILAVKEENKDSEKIKALSKALTSKEVKEFIEKQYKGSIIPSF
ncbi:MetQ/NlpA family ABC transporter substrate-binding protein [[Clostridium] dakarense]|uniref:MetQ/NlpA family ABC transporter substrate-binding protein n=1 Tax=Faecalimicrobium dakarense TaxID=1301100 RepID=UPI0005AA3C22|nr:MetQ/NlpA family ABC transporter substrate-binding protein [[Clostridium] dakarense]